MTALPSMEIPSQLRELAEKNVAQTKAAYDQFMTLARQGQDALAKSQGGEMSSALDVQTKAMRFAEQNIDAGFRLAAELARARNLTEYVEIQSRYAQAQALAFSQQAQELGRIVTEAAQKMQPPKF